MILLSLPYHLFVDFHGAYKPDEASSVHANMITMKGVMVMNITSFPIKMSPRTNKLAFTGCSQSDGLSRVFSKCFTETISKTRPAPFFGIPYCGASKFVIYEVRLMWFSIPR